ncbi:MAG: 2OG-Fe(II) oxygenase [Bacteroidetes bacterium]|nr:MAG: 2OG-Fe(II) oxygenase [Bacteroidota bacterium]
MQHHPSPNPEEQQFELLIEGLLEQQYGFCDDFIDPETVAGLRDNLLRFYDAGAMHPAGVGRHFDYQKNTQVRGDVIRWIEPDSEDPFERRFLERVQAFIRYLNQSCYAGINDFEFHYAFYEQHSFYKRHLDQFKSNKGRKFSLVTYLNENWQESDGGNLSLYLDATKQEDLYPVGGRTVFFKSDEIEHEVHPSHTRYRISIAGWLKRV